MRKPYSSSTLWKQIVQFWNLPRITTSRQRARWDRDPRRQRPRVWTDLGRCGSGYLGPRTCGSERCYMSFHQDSFTLPDGAELIAVGSLPAGLPSRQGAWNPDPPGNVGTGIARFGHPLPEQMRQGGAEPETMMEWARHDEVPLFLRNRRFFDLWITHDVMAADDTEAVVRRDLVPRSRCSRLDVAGAMNLLGLVVRFVWSASLVSVALPPVDA